MTGYFHECSHCGDVRPVNAFDINRTHSLTVECDDCGVEGCIGCMPDELCRGCLQDRRYEDDEESWRDDMLDDYGDEDDFCACGECFPDDDDD